MSRHREEVLNTTLAACIVARGLSADPETILKGGQARPDVMLRFRGLRCAIEGKIGDNARARSLAADDARGRLEQGIAHVAVAVVYPTSLRSAEFKTLAAEMVSTDLDFMAITDSGGSNWHTGRVDDLLKELRRAHETIVRDDILNQAVETLTAGLDEVADALLDSAVTCDRLVLLLGIGGKADAEHV